MNPAIAGLVAAPQNQNTLGNTDSQTKTQTGDNEEAVIALNFQAILDSQINPAASGDNAIAANLGVITGEQPQVQAPTLLSNGVTKQLVQQNSPLATQAAAGQNADANLAQHANTNSIVNPVQAVEVQPQVKIDSAAGLESIAKARQADQNAIAQTPANPNELVSSPIHQAQNGNVATQNQHATSNQATGFNIPATLTAPAASEQSHQPMLEDSSLSSVLKQQQLNPQKSNNSTPVEVANKLNQNNPELKTQGAAVQADADEPFFSEPRFAPPRESTFGSSIDSERLTSHQNSAQTMQYSGGEGSQSSNQNSQNSSLSHKSEPSESQSAPSISDSSPTENTSVFQQQLNKTSVANTSKTVTPQQVNEATAESINAQIKTHVSEFLNEITGKMETRHEVRIHLNPQSLGEVTVRIDHTKDSTMAVFVAENEMVKQVIEANLSQLENQLSETGLNINNIEVTSESSGFSSNQDPSLSDADNDNDQKKSHSANDSEESEFNLSEAESESDEQSGNTVNHQINQLV